jgi:glycosyltransferase involved in cell wall biosynthesis
VNWQGLRVGLVGPLPPPAGGMANQTRQLAELLEGEGAAVTLVQTNAPYRPAWIETWTHLRALFRLVPYMVRLWRCAGRVDLFHVMANSGWSWHLFALPAIWIARVRGVPVLVHYRGGEAPAFLERSVNLVRWSLRAANLLVVPSGFLREVFGRYGILAEELPNVVDVKRFAGAPCSSIRPPHIVITRNLEAIYGVATALHAFTLVRIKVPDARLSIAGGGPEKERLLALASTLGISQSVTFTGCLDRDEVADLCRSADVLLNPSLADNSPNSVLEALACGLPVVSTCVGGVPYIVVDGVSALLVNPGDADGMAKALTRVLRDANLARALRAGGAAAVQKHTWTSIRPRLREIYERAKRVDVGTPVRAPMLLPAPGPRLAVFTTLFPHAGQPTAGLFIRERMFRVAAIMPLVVVVPVPWFPLQGLMRFWRPHFRVPAPRAEVQEGVEVQFPRFLSVPGALKWLDGASIAVCCLPLMLRLKRSFGFNVIDSHFAYPDGYAATLLGRWTNTPVTVTLRGTEVPLSRDAHRRRRIVAALDSAVRVFAVSGSLRRHAIALGAPGKKIVVVGNGVDMDKFHRVDREAARTELGIPPQAHVLVSVGALVERKGFHRVIECMPYLVESLPDLIYLVIGGPGPEGDWSAELQQFVTRLGLEERVIFLGSLPPQQIKVPLSAADVFVLATSNEGWPNVFLEAMACGLPVVATDVGGNSEVVSSPHLGIIVPPGDRLALSRALKRALEAEWDRERIISFARANSWNQRVEMLTREFEAIVDGDRDHRTKDTAVSDA